jgi:regulator of protease activity HflC (stomatin/prohibitin superfamily)
MPTFLGPGTLVVLVVLMILASAIRVLREYERAVVFRLGRAISGKGPGLIFLIPFVDKMVATSQLAQTTLRSVVGQAELDTLLAERERINLHLAEIIDQRTDPWGVKVSAVEVKDVDLPMEMKRAMAKQAEAERERRAKVINAEGEFQAAKRLAEAAEIIQTQPAALQLRYLQTLAEIATENNSTTLFPIPIDLFRPFVQGAANAITAPARPSPPPASA